jgi:hypothetical protein
MNIYPAGAAHIQPNATNWVVATWFGSLRKWISVVRLPQERLRADSSADSTQADDDFRDRRRIEELQHPLILMPHCISMSAMPGRLYIGGS